MTQFRMGQQEAARGTYERLQRMLKEPAHAADWQAHLYLSEARAVLEGKGAKKQSPKK